MGPRSVGSPGCSNCRSRRIKCNLLRPRCSQCTRAGLACTGYRSVSDLRFRDETLATIRKFNPPKAKPDSGRSDTIDLGSPVSLIPLAWIEEIAQHVFFQNFSIMSDSCRSSFIATQTSPACISLTSVGLAALAVTKQDSKMMHLARLKYSSALGLLRNAVRNPLQSNSEHSVAAGFILSMFEVIVEKPPTTCLWVEHAHGTAALLGSLCSVRGVPVDQAKELLEISYTLILASLISKRPVPKFLLHLAADIAKEAGETKFADALFVSIRLFSIMSNLINLSVATQENSGFSPTHVVISAIECDQALQAWASSLSPDWVYHTEDSHHVYSSPWVARNWNYYRLSRVLANKIILHSLDALSISDHTVQSTLIGKSKLQYDQSTSVITELLQEIYTNIYSMFDFRNRGPASIPLSSDIFFVIIILQSLSSLTGKKFDQRDWPTQPCEALGKNLTVVKEILKRNM